ncbi:flagellar basal body-associated protein FliL [Vibrio ulleungensis]|uniref:Flagellar protein FliL n=1 Tax=Vibrio ulleungensis TaxID=2807619 RepID=A0ABS2HFI6_9VIBR|nr:flagellar basal body-associated protein FliL [Vibrio ulleungensis]MBM7036325.1 flagellar basal body-associated protein FliL [Vibrio ulleungensis]
MADDNPADTGNKKSNKLIIIIVAAVVLIAGIGGGAFFFLSSGDDSATASSGQPQSVSAPQVEAPAMYVNIPQPFLFTVPGNDRDRLVQIKVQLMVRGTANEGLARHHSPLIESTLLSSFGSASQEQLRSPSGRTDMRDQATNDIKLTLTELVGEPVIERVLFTDFVIQ